jgi:hypothetical protein
MNAGGASLSYGLLATVLTVSTVNNFPSVGGEVAESRFFPTFVEPRTLDLTRVVLEATRPLTLVLLATEAREEGVCLPTPLEDKRLLLIPPVEDGRCALLLHYQRFPSRPENKRLLQTQFD